MDIYSWCSRLEIQQNLLEEINDLVRIKFNSDEKDLVPRMLLLEAFIAESLVNPEVKRVFDYEKHSLMKQVFFLEP